MKTLTIGEDKHEAKEIIKLLIKGSNYWLEAGRRYVGFKKRNARAEEILIAMDPKIDISTLKLLEDVGSGRTLPQLLANNGPVYCWLRKLPIEKQKMHIEKGFEILIEGEVHRVLPERLPPKQLLQVKRGRKVRTIDEQRIWLEKREVKSLPRKPMVSPSGVYIFRAGLIERTEFLKLAEQLSGQS